MKQHIVDLFKRVPLEQQLNPLQVRNILWLDHTIWYVWSLFQEIVYVAHGLWVSIIFTEYIYEWKGNTMDIQNAWWFFFLGNNHVIMQLPNIITSFKDMIVGERRWPHGEYNPIESNWTFTEYVSILTLHELLHSIVRFLTHSYSYVQKYSKPSLGLHGDQNIINDFDKQIKDWKNHLPFFKQYLTPERENRIDTLSLILWHLKTIDTVRHEYWLFNNDELLSELANPGFVHKLMSIPLPPDLIYKPIKTSLFEMTLSVLSYPWKMYPKNNAAQSLLDLLSDRIQDPVPNPRLGQKSPLPYRIKEKTSIQEIIDKL